MAETNVLKILILTKSVDGGTGTYVKSLAKLSFYLRRAEIKICVLEKPLYRSLNKKFASQCHFFSKNAYPKKYKANINNFLNFIKEGLWLKRLTYSYKPDLLFGVGTHSNLLLMTNRILSLKKSPAILTTHIDLKRTLLDKSTPILAFFLKAAISFFYKKAEINICVSKGLKKSLARDFYLPRNAKTIYNGIEIKKRPKPSSLSLKKPIFITITRLTEQKDNKTLIKAFKKVVREIPKAKLFIIGDGPMKSGLVRLVKNLKVEKNVKFKGWVKNVNSFLKKSNVFVLSSKREGLPYVLIEAMSLGKAIISTNSPYGPKEILSNGKYGILTPVFDENSLTKAMLKLSRDKNIYRYYALKALERARDFSEEKMLTLYASTIEDLL